MKNIFTSIAKIKNMNESVDIFHIFKCTLRKMERLFLCLLLQQSIYVVPYVCHQISTTRWTNDLRHIELYSCSLAMAFHISLTPQFIK